jgi:competence protein ComEA
MEKLVELIQPFKQYIIEITLVGLSAIVVMASIVIYVVAVKAEPQKQQTSSQTPPQAVNHPSTPAEEDSSHIVVDMTGAVLKPDSYKLPTAARLKDALVKAGGLSELADKDFFYRNFNLARLLSDQEKIYVPSVLEVSSGIFKESSRLLESLSPPDSPLSENANSDEQSSKIHINSASLEELDSLPSVGATTAQNIIDNRPYADPDELTSKKVVGAATFTKIKDLIDL